ncbi:hypothetical protein ACFS7Z_23435 [Pontibacter toksunensis]|uniref:Uncharacterized protein n=1 Tax=Pontibacter toksunensis TaxID=1332631 RepID=A0ABW6C5V6_9BACT
MTNCSLPAVLLLFHRLAWLEKNHQMLGQLLQHLVAKRRRKMKNMLLMLQHK